MKIFCVKNSFRFSRNSNLHRKGRQGNRSKQTQEVKQCFQLKPTDKFSRRKFSYTIKYHLLTREALHPRCRGKARCLHFEIALSKRHRDAQPEGRESVQHLIVSSDYTLDYSDEEGLEHTKDFDWIPSATLRNNLVHNGAVCSSSHLRSSKLFTFEF